MALTEPELKVLATLSMLNPSQSLSVEEICGAAGFAEQAVRHALLRLSRSGLIINSTVSASRWKPTDRGRRVTRQPVYRDYAS
ncbi:hypothetical protein [Nocardia jejuensis]|uniref:hypothetical protein n=1 Tax=Nocardia jejuensis TaxID=328049 RepID=UPI000B10BE03|nr:hypothetical protein [Nocardia jejuensis]